MRRSLSVFAIVIALLMAGCTIQPSEGVVIDGPLVGSRIQASFTYDGTGAGKIELVMPNGEVCKGRYLSNRWRNEELLFDITWWVRYFGSDFDPIYMQYGRGYLIGDYGRIAEIEYFTGFRGLKTYGFGLGKDNEGNIYKIVF